MPSQCSVLLSQWKQTPRLALSLPKAREKLAVMEMKMWMVAMTIVINVAAEVAVTVAAKVEIVLETKEPIVMETAKVWRTRSRTAKLLRNDDQIRLRLDLLVDRMVKTVPFRSAQQRASNPWCPLK